ncbi:short chain dehydrogenase family protein [Mycobacterium kansasii 662]|uniref:Short chain dehydrogenase family protein n=1 Tax=Mycobacterium kansasii 662 TaxID=1299326 RepID=X7XQ76_MYCKA|nr:short chain dehydrogenase family protein [Mycobacterium kansasii 662]
MLWGLGRSLALEHPEIWGGLIDLDDSVPTALAARQVLAAAGSADEEDQVVYRLGTRLVPRLRWRPVTTEPVTLSSDTSQLVIGATGNIGPHLIRRLAQMGAGTVVAVSRNPGDRLHELAETLAAAGKNLVTVGRGCHRRRRHEPRCSTGSAPTCRRWRASIWLPSPDSRCCSAR